MFSMSDLHWLAGLVEGEGCFGFKCGPRICPYFCIAMKDFDVMSRAAQLITPGIPPRVKCKSEPGMYDIRISGPKAVAWMFTLFPLMGSRRKAKIVQCIGAWKAMPGMMSAKRLQHTRDLNAARRAATHCRNGHPFSGDNLCIQPNGQRKCRTCANARRRIYNSTEKGKANNRRQYLARKDRLKLVI